MFSLPLHFVLYNTATSIPGRKRKKEKEIRPREVLTAGGEAGGGSLETLSPFPQTQPTVPSQTICDEWDRAPQQNSNSISKWKIRTECHSNATKDLGIPSFFSLIVCTNSRKL